MMKSSPTPLPSAPSLAIWSACRAVTGREEDAVSTAHGVLDSARSLLTDPDRLRAWLFALARVEILAASAPQAREIFDLVHRHGIRPEDLPVVLGISPVEADELLAAAEEEVGIDDRADRDQTAYLNEGQPDLAAVESRGEMFETQLAGVVAYCRALTGREDDAVSTAHAVLGSARSLLTDPDRLRAWLFALARREMLGDAAPGAQEILDLVHQLGIRAEDLPIALGIPPSEADELLAAAEEEPYAAGAFSPGLRDADSRHSEGWRDDRSWDDRAAAWDSSAAWDNGADWDGGADCDETFGPKRHRLQDIYGLFRQPPESGGRHAAPGSGVAGLRQALARGPVPVAAATGIVVAVIGVSGAYLAESNSRPPSPAGQQTKHRPSAAAQSPATTPSPTPTATPTQRTSQPVTVMLPPPAPAPTSPSPKPASSSAKPSPSPKPTSSSPKPSPSPPPASQTPTPSPSPS